MARLEAKNSFLHLETRPVNGNSFERNFDAATIFIPRSIAMRFSANAICKLTSAFRYERIVSARISTPIARDNACRAANDGHAVEVPSNCRPVSSVIDIFALRAVSLKGPRYRRSLESLTTRLLRHEKPAQNQHHDLIEHSPKRPSSRRPRHLRPRRTLRPSIFFANGARLRAIPSPF